MSESDQIVDYEGFKGAGGPRSPPPQKPNTNPTRERLIMLGISLVGIVIAFILFSSPFNTAGTFLPHIIGALWAGFTIALYDWIIEAYAYVKGLWFCYGGYQKIRKLDFKHVPIDMVIGFIVEGFIFTIASYFPQLFRHWGWNFWPISEPAMDIVGVIIILIGMALVSAYGDFRTKRSGVWMNGPTWTYWKCAFYAWLPMLTSGIVVDRLIFLTWTTPALLTLTLLLPLLIEFIIIIILLKKVL